MADTQDASMASIELTREFIDKRGPTFHKAFGAESHFNTALSRYQSRGSADLEETLKQFKATTWHQADFDFDLLKCTWDDVLRELEKAQVAACESEANGKKPHRKGMKMNLPNRESGEITVYGELKGSVTDSGKAWRAFGKVPTEITSSGLMALPDDLSILHGGLAVVFCLARLRAQNRQKILRAFEDIPNVVMMASSKAENLPSDHPRSELLHSLTRDLQQTLLCTLPTLIARLNPGTFIEKAMSPFMGNDIDDLLAAVRRSSDNVRACAEGMMDNIIVVTHQTVHDNYETTQNIHNITQQTEDEITELHGKIEQILLHQRSFQLTLDSISGKNSLLSFLLEYLKPGQREEEMSPKQPPPAYESATPVTPRHLLQLMKVRHLGALDDEHYIIRRGGHLLDSDAISHAASMFQTNQVQQLLHLPNSGVVLVNGCTDRSQHNRISSITYVCATLTHALRRSPKRNVVLAFFCGQHSASNDDLVGPQGLMRSLVAHLVLTLVQDTYISDSAPIQFPPLQGDIEQLSFKSICQLFYSLVELIPKGVTLHCVIDGISYYERPGFKEDYDLMMECFGSIITNGAMGVIFKLLLTSPTTSHWLLSLLMPHQRVSLRNLRRRGTTDPGTYLQAVFENAGS